MRQARRTPRRVGLGRSLVAAVGALLCVAAVLWQPSPVAAQNDQLVSVDLALVSEVPWQSGLSVNGAVTVTATRAVSGTVSVVDSPQGGSVTTYEFDLDLAAGSEAVLPVTFTTGWEGVQGTVAVRSGGAVVAEDSVQRFGEGASDGGLVATLGIDEPPRRVPEFGSDRQLATIALDDGLRGLEGSSSVVATRSAIGDLGSGSIEALRLEAWIRGGGQLVVDGPTRSLDDSFHRFPTANPDRFSFGAGSVIYNEAWEDGISLGGYLGIGGLRELVESQDLGTGAAGELALLANIALPAVSLVAGALFIYTVIAGPVVFGLASARRAFGKIWIVLPALSALFAVGILGIGVVSRSGRTDAHVTIVEVGEQGSRATSNLLLTSRFGGNRSFETPEGWTYLGQGQTNSQRQVLLRVGASSTDVSIDVPPGANSMARLRGPASEYDNLLSIDNIRLEGGSIAAEVTNNSTAELTDAIAFFGNARAEIGTVEEGETVTFFVERSDVSGRTMKELLIWPKVRRVWGNEGGMPMAVPENRETKTAAGAWTEWRITQGASASPQSVVGVAGWTDGLASPVADIKEGRTALFVRTNVPPSVLGESGFTVNYRMPSRQVEPVFDRNFAGFPEDYRVTLNEGTDVDRLAVKVADQSAAIGFLIDGAWQYAELPDSGRQTLSIPPAAVQDGEVQVRSYVPEWVWGVGATAFVVADDSDAVAPVLGERLTFRNPDGGFGDFEDEAMEEFFPVPPTTIVGEPAQEIDIQAGEAVDLDSVIVLGQFQAYRFSLEAGQSVITSMATDAALQLELLSPSGEILAFSDIPDGTDEDVEALSYEAPDSGTYELRVWSFEQPEVGYRLTVEVVE